MDNSRSTNHSSYMTECAQADADLARTRADVQCIRSCSIANYCRGFMYASFGGAAVTVLAAAVRILHMASQVQP